MTKTSLGVQRLFPRGYSSRLFSGLQFHSILGRGWLEQNYFGSPVQAEFSDDPKYFGSKDAAPLTGAHTPYLGISKYGDPHHGPWLC